MDLQNQSLVAHGLQTFLVLPVKETMSTRRGRSNVLPFMGPRSSWSLIAFPPFNPLLTLHVFVVSRVVSSHRPSVLQLTEVWCCTARSLISIDDDLLNSVVKLAKMND